MCIQLIRTVDGEVTQGGAGGSLNLDIGTLEEEEDWLKGVALDLANIYYYVSIGSYHEEIGRPGVGWYLRAINK